MFQFPPNFADLQPAPFCTQENFATSVTYLSKELTTIGYPPLVPVGHDKLDVTVLVNVTYDLLKQVRDFKRNKAENESYSHRLTTDIQHLQNIICRQKESCQKKEREAAEALEKERQTSIRCKHLELSLKKLREENHQLAQECEQHQTQFQHALRRKEIECSRLNDQLLRFVQSKSSRPASNSTSSAPLEIEMTCNLPTQSSGLRGNVLDTSTRRKWGKNEPTNKYADEKWRLEVSHLEKEQESLRKEFQQLKNLVSSFVNRILQTKHFNNVGQKIGLQGKVDELFKLPIGSIPCLMDNMASMLTDELNSCHAARSTMQDRQATLEAQLHKAEELVKQKDILVDKLSAGANEEVLRMLTQWVEVNEVTRRATADRRSLEKAWAEYHSRLQQLENERATLDYDRSASFEKQFTLSSGPLAAAKYFSFTPAKNTCLTEVPSKMARSQISDPLRLNSQRNPSSQTKPAAKTTESVTKTSSKLRPSSIVASTATPSLTTRSKTAPSSNSTDVVPAKVPIPVAKTSTQSMSSSCSSSSDQSEKDLPCKLVRENTVIYTTGATNGLSAKSLAKQDHQSSQENLSVSDSDYEDSLDEMDSLEWSSKPPPTSVQLLQIAKLGEVVDTPVPSRRGSSASVPGNTAEVVETVTDEIERWARLTKGSTASSPHTSVSLTSNASVSAKVSIIQQNVDIQESNHDIPSGVSCSYRVTSLQ